MGKRHKPRKVKADKPAKEEVPLSEEQKTLVEDNMAIVDRLAKRMATRFIPAEDRRQDGMLGLIKAAQDYEPTHGATFRTYAYRFVLGAMVDAERAGEGNVIRVPRGVWQKMTDEERYRSQPNFRLRRMGRVSDAYDVGREKSVDVPAREDSEPPHDDHMIRIAVRRLGGKAAEAVDLYYWEDIPMREVGRRLDISESRVSQMHSEAIERLRDNPRIRDAVAV